MSKVKTGAINAKNRLSGHGQTVLNLMLVGIVIALVATFMGADIHNTILVPAVNLLKMTPAKDLIISFESSTGGVNWYVVGIGSMGLIAGWIGHFKWNGFRSPKPVEVAQKVQTEEKLVLKEVEATKAKVEETVEAKTSEVAQQATDAKDMSVAQLEDLIKSKKAET